MPSTKRPAPSQKSSQKIKKSRISPPTDPCNLFDSDDQDSGQDTEDNDNDSEDEDSKDEDKGGGDGEDEKESQEGSKKKDKVERVVYVRYVPFFSSLRS